MRRFLVARILLGLLISVVVLSPSFAGDSLYGRVTRVRSAELVTLDYGPGEYEIRIIGIEAPEQGPLAREAAQFVSALVLGKNARMRFDHRAPNGEMLSRLFTDDPARGIQEVGPALLRAGLARRERGFDYKYGELAAAEAEAQNARRGLWATAPPR